MGATDRVRRHGAALAFAGVALLLRSWRLDAQPLWLDEALSAHIAAAPDGLSFVHNTPPLYHWCTRWWTDWFGAGAAGLRSLSVVAGAVFVWASFHAAWTAFGRRAAWVAAGFAAVAPLHVYYSQEARAYALMLALLMLALWMAWRLAAAPRAGAWIGLALSASGALYSHYLAAVPLSIAAVVIPCGAPVGRRVAALRATGSAVAAAALLLAPWWWWWSRHTPFAPSDMRWLELLWAQLAGPRALAWSGELFVLGGEAGRTPVFLKQFSDLSFPAPLRLAALVGVGLTIAVAAGRALRDERARTVTWQGGLLCLGPLSCLWVVSLVRPVYAPGRYDLIAFPAFVVWFGGAAAQATRASSRGVRVAVWLALATVALALAAKDRALLTAPAAADPPAAVAGYLAAEVADGDAVVLCGAVGLPVLVHLRGHGVVWQDGRCRGPRGVAFACRLLPTSLEQAPAAVSRYLEAAANGSLAPELSGLARTAGARTLWLVLGEELRQGAADPAGAAVGRALFEALFAAGYELVGGAPELGVARLVLRSGR